MVSRNVWITLGAVLAALSVAAGALAAHGLDDYFKQKYYPSVSVIAGFPVPASWKHLQDFKTAAAYQMYHALGMIAVGMLSLQQGRKTLQGAGWCFLIGIVLFSGGLYVYTLFDLRIVGMIPVPIGGTLFIVGWVLLAAGACPCGKSP